MSELQKFWDSKKVLITGHTGFKGSWLSLFLNYLNSDLYGISREKKEGIYKISKLEDLFESELFTDIATNDNKVVEDYIKTVEPDIVFHFAAQSLVIEGYKNPKDTIYSNIIGSYNIMEVVNEVKTIKSLIISTTDKVYKNSNSKNKEDSELGGKGFYSSSKVAVENLITAFINSTVNKDLNISTVRSGNVIGGGERANDRLLTDLIKSAQSNKDFILRMPDSIRPWQYILDSIYGYLLVAEDNFNNGRSEVFNLNSEPNNKFNSKYLSDLFIKNWGSQIKVINENQDKFKEVDILTINSEKAKNELGWSPKYDIPNTINNIVAWEKHHMDKESHNPDFSLKQISDYLQQIN